MIHVGCVLKNRHGTESVSRSNNCLAKTRNFKDVHIMNFVLEGHTAIFVFV